MLGQGAGPSLALVLAAPQQLPSVAGAGNPGTNLPCTCFAAPRRCGASSSRSTRDLLEKGLVQPQIPLQGVQGACGPRGPLFAAPCLSPPAFLGASMPDSRGCDLAPSLSLPLIYIFFLSSRSRSTNFDSPLPQRPARLKRGYSEPSLYHRTRLTRGSAPPQVTAEHEASRWEQHSPQQQAPAAPIQQRSWHRVPTGPAGSVRSRAGPCTHLHTRGACCGRVLQPQPGALQSPCAPRSMLGSIAPPASSHHLN